MLVQAEKINIERSADFKQTGFTIKASAKAFKILSDGLYSNKVKAIVRELGTNAVDAHIAAGKGDTPFKVHLPNPLAPHFSIRDFGTGLSPEDITSIYTTYFESNKANSNDYTGCLGLGSKSPFSYTDNFTVTDYFNGVKHLYAATIAETGTPTIMLINSQETSEPNGLEVMFAVKPMDFARFANEAGDVYSYFKVKPEIVGNTVTFKENEVVFADSNWQVCKKKHGSRLVMGNVAYPIAFHNAGCGSNVSCTFDHYDIIINVGIGEAEMTASRESLEYTEHTKNVIQKAATECNAHFRSNMQKEMDKCETYWDACHFYHNNQIFLQSASWQGRAVQTSIYLNTDKWEYMKFEAPYGGHVHVRKKQEMSRVYVYQDYTFIDHDIERGAIARTRQYVKDNAKKDVYLISFRDAAHKDRFVQTLGIKADAILKASDLPKVKAAPRGASVPSPRGFIYREANKVTACWSNGVDIYINGGVVYVILDGFQADMHYSTIKKLLNFLEALGKPVVLYGVRKPLSDKVAKLNNWTHLKDYCQEVLKSFTYDDHMIYHYGVYTRYYSMVKLLGAIQVDALDKLVKKVQFIQTNADKLDAIKDMREYLHIPQPVVSSDIPEVQELHNKYPLLMYVFENRTYNAQPLPIFDLQKYVEMIDKTP